MNTVLLASCLLLAPSPSPAQRWSFVDEQGVLRWRDDRAEIALFGVNYYTPFTVDYEGISNLQLDHRSVITQDVTHFKRLGLDAVRLHVFDRQISDREGNLISNQHLELFDFLVASCKQEGIYTVLTPIAWWHYHFPDNGFSSLYTKPQMVLDPRARRAQVEYLRQFMEHVNPFTKLAYKDEPAIVAIELINEPQYDNDTTIEQIRDYMDELAAAVRSTGASQPIFYNGWGGKEEAVARSTIEGCTFGWYPTGLVSGRCLRDNYLPIVDDYPGMRLDCLQGKAKVVYEFDAADVPGNVMYPAMARAFRSGGAQIATQFQYDPLPLAAFNYGWQTHYLNLAYAPAKTMSFAIAAEVFRTTPRLARFPEYPHNATFGPFTICYEKDLSEMVSDETFLYANDTDTAPPAPDKLTRIAGVGSSPVVRYDGTGAYFLDRVDQNSWRLELFPDAVWVDNPFATTNLQREVSRIIWKQHSIQIQLPTLGDNFNCRQLAPTEATPQLVTTAKSGGIQVQPGAYLLWRNGTTAPPGVSPATTLPPQTRHDVAVWWQCPEVWRAGTALPVEATVAADCVNAVLLHLDAGEPLPLTAQRSYIYRVQVPKERIASGRHRLQLEVQTPQGSYWFPPDPNQSSAQAPSGRPSLESAYRLVEVLPATAPAPLFVAARQPVRLEGQEHRRVETVPGHESDQRAVRITVERFDPSPSAVYFRSTVPEAAEAWRDSLAQCNVVVITARALTDATDRVELVLLEKDSAPWGTEVTLTREWQEIVVPLSRLRYFAHWIHPQGRGGDGDRFRPEQVGAVNVCFGAWLYGDRSQQPHGLDIESITLDRR